MPSAISLYWVNLLDRIAMGKSKPLTLPVQQHTGTWLSPSHSKSNVEKIVLGKKNQTSNIINKVRS